MGGYFVGRFLGRHKLAEELSPNKTKEGALGGLIAAILMSVLLLFIGQRWGGVFSRFSYTEFIFLGLVMGFLGQVGDLAESLLKRDVGVKDSNKIPGVGGLLDMVDSLLFTSPLVYLFLKFHYL
jgi:phosphatidate cytidylyltransferase